MFDLKRFDIEEIIRTNQGSIDATVEALFDLLDTSDLSDEMEVLQDTVDDLENDLDVLRAENLKLCEQLTALQDLVKALQK